MKKWNVMTLWGSNNEHNGVLVYLYQGVRCIKAITPLDAARAFGEQESWSDYEGMCERRVFVQDPVTRGYWIYDVSPLLTHACRPVGEKIVLVDNYQYDHYDAQKDIHSWLTKNPSAEEDIRMYHKKGMACYEGRFDTSDMDAVRELVAKRVAGLGYDGLCTIKRVLDELRGN